MSIPTILVFLAPSIGSFSAKCQQSSGTAIITKQLCEKILWIKSIELSGGSEALRDVDEPSHSADILFGDISWRVQRVEYRFSAYMYYGIAKHMPNKNVSMFQVTIATSLAVLCFWVYYKACATSPGHIKK